MWLPTQPNESDLEPVLISLMARAMTNTSSEVSKNVRQGFPTSEGWNGTQVTFHGV